MPLSGWRRGKDERSVLGIALRLANRAVGSEEEAGLADREGQLVVRAAGRVGGQEGEGEVALGQGDGGNAGRGEVVRRTSREGE